MFIETISGVLVNLNHVVRAVSFSTEKCHYYRLIDSNNDNLGEIYSHQGEHLTDASFAFPSWPNTKGIIITWTEDEVWSEECDIVGWKLSGSWGTLSPILIETLANNQCVLIRTPDGSLCEPEHYNFKTVEEAKEYYRKRCGK